MKAAKNSEKKLRLEAEKRIGEINTDDEAFQKLQSDYKALKESKGDDGWKLQEKNYQAEISKRDSKISELTETVDTMTAQSRANLLRDTITGLVPKTVKEGAMKDIHLRAEHDLEFSQDLNGGKGGFVAKESGMEASDWFAVQLKESGDVWLADSTSGNAPGNTNPQDGSKTIKSDEFYAKSLDERETLMADGYKLT